MYKRQVRFVLQPVLDPKTGNPIGGVFSLDNSNFDGFPIGAFIDGIEPVNCDTLESLPPTTYNTSTTSVPLDTTTGGGALVAGNPYTLRLRVRIGCHWFPFGQSLDVTPVAASSLSDYELWFRGQFPIIGGFADDFDQDGIPNALERIFGLSPIDSTDATSALTPQIAGGNIELSHAIIPGETITAEYSSTLDPNSWLPATVNISGGTATASVPLNLGTAFLRWVVDE